MFFLEKKWSMLEASPKKWLMRCFLLPGEMKFMCVHCVNSLPKTAEAPKKNRPQPKPSISASPKRSNFFRGLLLLVSLDLWWFFYLFNVPWDSSPSPSNHPPFWEDSFVFCLQISKHRSDYANIQVAGRFFFNHDHDMGVSEKWWLFPPNHPFE